MQTTLPVALLCRNLSGEIKKKNFSSHHNNVNSVHVGGTKLQTTRRWRRARSMTFSQCLWPLTPTHQTSNHIISLVSPRTLRSTPPGRPTPSWGTRPSRPGGRRACWPRCCPRCSGCATAASPPHRPSCSLASSRHGLDEKCLYKMEKKKSKMRKLYPSSQLKLLYFFFRRLRIPFWLLYCFF